MSQGFSSSERFIAFILRRFPRIKSILKRIYYRLQLFFFKKHYKVSTVNNISNVSNERCNSFFGYYDKSPLNIDGSKVLFNSFDAKHNPPYESLGSLDVCVSQFPSGNILTKVTTRAFNLQQGCRAQWLDSKRFIYNDFNSATNKYIAHIFDIESNAIEATVNSPIYDTFCSNERSFALALSFEQLSRYSPDYGYFCHNDSNSDSFEISDAVTYIDIADNSISSLISLKQVLDLNYRDEFDSANHVINHIMISPQGDSFIFIHRWYVRGRRFDRLIHFRFDNSRMTVLIDNEVVSHCFWINSREIIGYLRGPDSKMGYWKIKLDDFTWTYLNVPKRFGDGHPHKFGTFFVTDTYPDRARMQSLLKVDLETGETSVIGEFFHGLEFESEYRCDLHPRVSHCGNYVFLDTVYDGIRKLVWTTLS